MAEMLFFEDFAKGQVFNLGTHTITAEEIIDFASEFDPQPQHLDAEAAKHSLLGGLASSGWGLCALAMRMLVDNLLIRCDSLGSPGVNEVQWRRPVMAGDTLKMVGEVVETRASAGRPDRGFVTLSYSMYRGDTRVMTFASPLMIGRRGARGG